MSILIYCGLLTLGAAYVVHIFLPQAISFLWQISQPLLGKWNAHESFPRSSNSLFYSPRNDDPLVFHSFIPNHKTAILVNFTVGVLLGFVLVERYLTADAIMQFVLWLTMAVYLYVILKLSIKKVDFWNGLQQLTFATVSVIKVLVSLSLVSRILN